MVLDHLGALPECLELGRADRSELVVGLAPVFADARVVRINVPRAVALDVLQQRHGTRGALRQLLLRVGAPARGALRGEDAALKRGWSAAAQGGHTELGAAVAANGRHGVLHYT